VTEPAPPAAGSPSELDPEDRRRLLVVLEEARALGLLGPGSAGLQLDHALGFGPLLPPGAGAAMDLGSGGGVPALALALLRPDLAWLLVEAGRRRTEFLDRAILTLDLADRVRTSTGRAEALGVGLRGAFDVVTARGFGPPPVVAECAAPWLRVGGTIIVSEPPGGDARRWPATGLAELGLVLDLEEPGPPAFVRLRGAEVCPRRFPRRTGVPAKRPIW
jgi:16S rRNA (guanine527-N7)-methyltransferase